ncbi:Maf family protein [Candidatus Venteria ishoeyi]|uniref:dTTP/UTP pyrophosphatase n=1 Tax=Candidatus Venteria ishoeyi TaxID=1899563 RepID=A0A1H6FD45_9GAMM|nr:Maf family protein [Candidatus Venteria ishoeyi]SEH07998.1 Maf-like protein YhdE [Candidatus Venteria ishoeyi]
MPKLYLASASPRRHQLLQQLSISCEVLHADIDETPRPKELPEDYVQRLAMEKAKAVYATLRIAPYVEKPVAFLVLGADTAVVLEQQIFGKPEHAEDAHNMLRQLSGCRHQVMSAVTLLESREQAQNLPLIHQALNVTTVQFRQLSNTEIDDYIATGESFGKAGAYAVQGFAATFIQSLHGSYSGVMGLPLFETANLLQKAGFNLLPSK